MRRYTIKIDDTEHVLDVEEVGSDTFSVQLAGGRLVEVRLIADQDIAAELVTPGGIQVPAADQATAPLTVPHTPPGPADPDSPAGPAVIAAPAPRSPRPAGHPHLAGQDVLSAPMPGVVLSVAVVPGQAVTRGQSLLVLEAMKMKNEMRAEQDAIVARVLVQAGDQVKHGDPLVRFESAGS
ncbi:MAG: biotin/lipoyl-containing protein [Candidatus Nanopelagicales bacterium]